MTRNADGSVLLRRDEAETLAKVLRLSRELAEQLEADEHESDVLEHQLLSTLELLEDLGVSSEELLGVLDQRVRTG